MNEKHFRLINEFLNFFVNNALLTENHKFLEFRQTSVLTFGYPGFQKKKRFCDELVKGKRAPTQILVTTNFSGNSTPTHILEKRKKVKQ